MGVDIVKNVEHRPFGNLVTKGEPPRQKKGSALYAYLLGWRGNGTWHLMTLTYGSQSDNATGYVLCNKFSIVCGNNTFSTCFIKLHYYMIICHLFATIKLNIVLIDLVFYVFYFYIYAFMKTIC